MHICNCVKVYFADGSMKYLTARQYARYKDTGIKPRGGHR